jgi:hypothetical protein
MVVAQYLSKEHQFLDLKQQLQSNAQEGIDHKTINKMKKKLTKILLILKRN